MNKRAGGPALGAEHDWYRLGTEEVLARLDVDPGGLDSAEVQVRRAVHGGNVIEEGRRRGPLAMLLGQFTDFMILVLLAAAVVSGVLGDLTDTLVILGIVVLNAVVGFIQEYRAERAIAALKEMAAPVAHVVRDGAHRRLPAAELVPGDIVLLEAGNGVPADLRLIEAAGLRTEEAALTGESQPVDKHTRALPEPDLPLGDRRNMVYKGTLVTAGRARAVVVAIGMATELGRIARLLRAAEEVKTPLQRRLAVFGRWLAIAILAICALMFVAGWLRGEPLVLMLLTAISLAVAAIPEALPAVVTMALALGAARMVRRHVLIRKLPAVETLGSVTFICSDKTGTLTLNRMRVEELYGNGRLFTDLDAASREAPALLFHALAVSNDARRDAKGAAVGDPTEVALLEVAARAGYDKAGLLEGAPRIAELPFDAERARMSTLHREAGGVMAYTKGAPERVLDLCQDAWVADRHEPLDRAAIAAMMERMAADGLRVLAVGFRRLQETPEEVTAEVIETGITFLGLVGILDPPRPEAAEAIALCRSAGITPVMITGDHPATARNIARRLGIIADEGQVVTGQELARLSMPEFEARVEAVRVYARVAPEQKIKIVQALQDRGELVAMTGDGVNDAPALKRADIGVAMGITGTDVAKEAGHMVLLDDNFASIVAAVREGRHIYDNIRKFIRFILSGNSGEIATLFLAPFLGLPLPLLPIHILWINLVTDGLPALALAVEPEERGIMQRPPRPPTESLFARGIWQHIVWVGLLMAALSLITQAYAMAAGLPHWQTMVFTVLTCAQMAHVLAIRSERQSLFAQGVGSNLPLLGAVLLTLVLQLALIYVPLFNDIFKTEPLTAGELAFSLAMASVVFFAVETEKALIRRGWLYANAAPR